MTASNGSEDANAHINPYPIRKPSVVFQRRITRGGLLIILVKTQEKSIFSQSNLRRENNKEGFSYKGGGVLIGYGLI